MIEQVKQNIKEQLKTSKMTIQELCKLMRKDRKYIYQHFAKKYYNQLKIRKISV